MQHFSLLKVPFPENRFSQIGVGYILHSKQLLLDKFYAKAEHNRKDFTGSW